MTGLHIRRATAALLVLATTAGSGQIFAQQPVYDDSAGLTTAEIESLFHARTDSARTHFTEADVAFVTGMIAHHAQALVMSKLAPTHGASPSVQTLASRIINSQRDEIAIMQTWLSDRDQPVPDPMAHGAHGHMMPGMLTAEQLEELGAAYGSEFDRLFLTYMIQHHSGALTMVHDLFGVDGAGQGAALFKLASNIQADQITEIERMKKMLAAMPVSDVSS